MFSQASPTPGMDTTFIEIETVLIRQARVSLHGDGHGPPGEAFIAHSCLIDIYCHLLPPLV
jgi:hypothetical protein